MSTRSGDLADELKQVIRLAGRDPEALETALPVLSGFHRAASVDALDEPARVHFILRRLIPEYLDRLPAGRDCRAIRELMTWEDEDGESQSLTTRYHKAAAHLVNAASDFGRRQEPRLLAECARRFIAFDHEDRLGAGAPAGEVAAALPSAPVVMGADRGHAPPPLPPVQSDAVAGAVAVDAGIVQVHKNLDYHLLVDLMVDAEEIVILNTWIPELNILDDALVDALARGTYVSILMLYPDSHIAQLRSEALQGVNQARVREDRVKPGVRHCLEVLAAIARTAGDEGRRRLRVRLYHSLPSISVYGVDDRAFFSVFLHGQLAVKSPQIEVLGQESLMGRLVFRELETLWETGHEFEDLEQWQTELEDMGRKFGFGS
ncbi:MAG TPA: hypothetical protein VNA28_05360 [Solirubrobacteraceae bacterium]|nr:hypothetical protein [Solirubrobacteraceae bacterium]